MLMTQVTSSIIPFNKNIPNAIQQNLFYPSLSYVALLFFSAKLHMCKRDTERKQNFIRLLTFLSGIQESYQQFTDVHTTQRGKM